MIGRYTLCALFFVGCAGPTVTADTKPKSQAESKADYSVSQLSASQPERNSAKPEAPVKPLENLSTLTQGCDAEACDGVLSGAATAQLRAAAAKTQDCYERELKDHPEVEGKWSVLLRLTSDNTKGAKPCPVTIERAGFQASDAFRQCLLDVLGQAQVSSTNGCVDVALPLSFVRQEVEVEASSTGQ